MCSDELKLNILRHGTLSEDLSEADLVVLAKLMTLQHYEIKSYPLTLDGLALQDALMILIYGDIEIVATVNGEHVVLHLAAPGDLARISSFVGGGDIAQSTITIKRDSSVLLLKRSTLEILLDTHPSLAYYVMRNLVRHIHRVLRKGNMEQEEMRNYLYCTHGRY